MNLINEIGLDGLKTAQISGQTTIFTDPADTANFNGVILLTKIPTASGSANYIKAQSCATADFTSATVHDISGRAYPTGDGQAVWIDISRSRERYVRLAIVRAGAATTTADVLAILYGIRTKPNIDLEGLTNGVSLLSPEFATPLGTIETPAITTPTSEEEGMALNPTFEASAFAAVDNTTAELAKSQWQLTTADDPDFEDPVADSEVSTGTLTEYIYAGTALASDADYLVRVRYFSTESDLGWSDWSPAMPFITISSGLGITSLNVTSGPNTGGTAVAITGTEFMTGATVKFNNVAATSVVVVSRTRITCVTPAGTTGARDVKVTNPDAENVTSTGAFTFISTPTVGSLNVTSGGNAGGTAVTITGTQFATGAEVKFGTVAATSVVVVGATSITCVSPAAAGNGAVSVTVTNADTGAGTKATAFTYFSSPTITNISPVSGPDTGSTAITITGTQFAATPTVTIGGVSATSIVRVGLTSITCVTPARSVGAKDVVVTNTDTGTVTSTGGFTYISVPTISNISASSGPDTGDTAITITGTEFAATPAVTIGGVTATSIVCVGPTSITCNTPAGTIGAQNVVVTNTDTGTVTSTGGFTYISVPTITLINPNTGTTSGGTAVTITGTDFMATPAVTFGGTTATSIVRVNATSITCVTPAKSAGAKNVVVTNTDSGTVTATNGFTYA